MILHDCKQYSAEWWELRRGIPTASSASKILTPTGKLSASANGYINELIADGLDLGDEPMEPTDWMKRGTELEPEARRLYIFETGARVKEVGFITNKEETAGCSPDGLIDLFTNRGGELSAYAGLEIKCPKPSTMIGYLRRRGLPKAYKPQVHYSMALTGLRRWVFMAYHPDLTPLIVTVKWDAYTDAVATALDDFIDDLGDARMELEIAA